VNGWFAGVLLNVFNVCVLLLGGAIQRPRDAGA
jgi:hypothetical protein